MGHCKARGLITALPVFILVFSPATCPADASTLAIRTLASDPSGLVLELTAPLPELVAEKENGLIYERVRVPGWAATTVIGHPELPLHGILIQVPPAGDVEIEIDAGPWRTLTVPMVKPVSVPEGALESDETGGARDPAAYGASHFFPGPLFELSPREIVRGVPVMRLILHPYQWNPATGELRCAAKLAARVRFQETLTDASAPSVPSSPAAHEPLASERHDSLAGIQAPGSPLRAARDAEPRFARMRLRLEIKQDGLYRVTYSDLVRAGVKVDAIDSRTLSMYNRGREVPIQVRARSARRLAPGDSIEFYAQGVSTPYTDTNVYWLRWGGPAGARIGTIDGSVPADENLSTSFPELLRFEENHTVWDTMPGAPEDDYWFWERLTAPASVTHPLTVPSPAPGPGAALLRLSLRGRTELSHTVHVFLNDVPVGDALWSGTGEHLQELPFPQSLIASGVIQLKLDVPPGASVDSLHLNWIEVAYERLAEAAGDELRPTFPAGGARAARVQGLSRPTVRVYDVTDPYQVRRLVGISVTPDGAGFQAVFGIDAVEARTYHVFTGSAVRTPARMTRWARSGSAAKPEGGADYLLITPRAFLNAAKPLLELRRRQGLRVKAAAVEDIYNTFSDGLPDPAALKRFIADAYRTWKRPAPAHVFLLGDANTDYRDYLGTGKRNLVPVHLSPTAALGATPDDNWYVCVDGDDDLPDLFVGRITVSDAAAAAAAVAKIVRYERQPRPVTANALFVADDNEAGFQELAEALAGSLPESIAAHRVYLPSPLSPVAAALAKEDLLRLIDAGTLMTTYVGHGDVTGWAVTVAGGRLLDTATVHLLNNENRLPFVVTLDCLNGYFSQPFYYSIGELLANIPSKGAIASFSPSGFGYLGEHELLGKELFSLAFAQNVRILGKMTTNAKLNAYARGASSDLVKTFTLFGDPATRLKTPVMAH